MNREKRIKEIEKQQKDNEINEILVKMAELFIASIIGAFIGYKFFKDLENNEIKGIILGICCPWGFYIVHKIAMYIYEYLDSLYKLLALITVGVSAILIFLLEIYISAYFGIIAFPVLIIYFILKIYKIQKADYRKFAEQRYYVENLGNASTNVVDLKQIKKSNNANFNFKSEYYCERCFKKITEEEFERYDCMCSECFEEVNSGNMI